MRKSPNTRIERKTMLCVNQDDDGGRVGFYESFVVDYIARRPHDLGVCSQARERVGSLHGRRA